MIVGRLSNLTTHLCTCIFFVHADPFCLCRLLANEHAAVLWCTATAVVSFPLCTDFYCRYTSHSLSVMTCCSAWVCLIVAHVHICDKNEGEAKKTNKKLIIFWWEQIYFKQVWNLHTVTANEVSCKIAVIIGILSPGTQLACAHACVCARV